MKIILSVILLNLILCVLVHLCAYRKGFFQWINSLNYEDLLEWWGIFTLLGTILGVVPFLIYLSSYYI